MRKLILLAILLALVGGCKKIRLAGKNPPPQPQPVQPVVQDDQPKIHPLGLVVIPPKAGGGGGGGAAQAVKQAVIRTANLTQLNQLQTYIATLADGGGGMPTRDQLAQSLSRDAPSLYKLWATDKVIEVPAKLRDDGVWAYTVTAQSQTGEHLVVTRSSIGRMSLADLEQRLKEQ